MEELRELINVVSRNKIKDLEIVGRDEGKSRYFDFYDRLLRGEFKDDKEAAHFYFGKEPGYSQYRKLKNKLRDRLINTTFFIDVNSPKFNDVQRAYYTCQRNVMAIRILLGRNARRSAISLARKTLKKSVNFEFSEISLEIARILRTHYAIHQKNLRMHLKYADLVKFYFDLCEAEDLAVGFYEHTSAMLNRSVVKKEAVLETCAKYLQELEPLTKKWDSYKLHLSYYFIALRQETLKANHRGILESSDRAISFFTAKGTVSEKFIGAFYYYKMMACVQLRDFKEGQSLAMKCNSIFEAGSLRWYNSQNITFILYMHDKAYAKAVSVRNQVVGHPSFSDQQQNRAEMWKIHDAYLFFLQLIGKFNPAQARDLKKFRLQKFLNEVPVYSLDKQGLNIPILVIQILILIQTKRRDLVNDRIEAIEKYTSRYLKKGSNYRSSCFIKMLLQIPKRQYHATAVKRHTNVLLRKLERYPLEKADQPFEIEIIPYEHLWEYALESLDNKFH